MEFLSINNDLCGGCKNCVELCPYNAISVINNIAHIDHDKCTACGLCYKQCNRNAIKLNIPVKTINQLLSEKAVNDEIKLNHDRLTSENKMLADEVRLHRSKFTTLVSKLNEAVVVIDRGGKVNCTNDHFINMLDSKSREEFLSRESIVGREFRNMVTPLFYRHLMYVQNSRTDSLNIATQVGNTSVSASIHPIRKGDYTIVLFRNMAQPMIVNDETKKRIESVIELNMSMVQKIGYLLGEEVSQTTNLLRQTIKCFDLPNAIEGETKDE